MSTIERTKQTERQLPAVLDPRVERGAALLDEKMPGWSVRVNLDDFELCSRCVLWHVYGNYGRGGDTLFGGAGFVQGTLDHGFYVESERPSEWNALEQDWRLAILSRRSP